MSNVTEEGKQWFALIPADELRSADLRVFGAGLWFVIYDCFCYEDQKKKCRFIYVYAIDVIYFRIHAKVNDDADLLIILEMFRSHSLWWLYRDIIIFLTRSVTRGWIISEMYLLFWHGDIGNFKAQVSALKKSWFTRGAIYHVQLFMYWRLCCSQLMKNSIL